MFSRNQIVKMLCKTKAVCLCNQCGDEYVCNIYDAAKSSTGDQCKQCNSQITSISEPTKENLVRVFKYDPLTGNLYYRNKSYSGLKGDVVGYRHSQGYLSTRIGGKDYLVHRLIWLMQTDKWPDEIDHIDHNRSNNIWTNLREVKPTDQQRNMKKRKNNSSGFQGIRVLPSGRYCAYIMVNKKQISLGTYNELNDALKARKNAEVSYGFHANHGS